MKRKIKPNNTNQNEQPTDNFDEDTNSTTAATVEMQNNNQPTTRATTTTTTVSNPMLASSSSSSTQCAITGRKSSSHVWQYAKKSDDGKCAMCKLCNYTCTSLSHSTSTMSYHLIRKH
ncbi:unnamed protein product [Rotaria magnacalcarata]|nr:unnamed protein product [Rotaria magnacalcarata]CAF1681869.1 unnamed protein product [Rotaria magnacalcarata]CAF4271160.1 unnamed protein product [Rotaria magnacalcarata]CAF4370045.1 unnamed protein product [Rotaria magnacalcarata]